MLLICVGLICGVDVLCFGFYFWWMIIFRKKNSAISYWISLLQQLTNQFPSGKKESDEVVQVKYCTSQHGSFVVSIGKNVY